MEIVTTAFSNSIVATRIRSPHEIGRAQTGGGPNRIDTAEIKCGAPTALPVRASLTTVFFEFVIAFALYDTFDDAIPNRGPFQIQKIEDC
jgi:hypothetical protein